jgi:hypothetical protein
METHSRTASYRASNKAAARLMLGTFGWAATLALVRFGPDLVWDAKHSAASWAAVAANILAGAAWIAAFARFLRALDDLWRQIMQDALAAALGVGWVTGFAYVAADAAGLIDYDFNVALFAVLLGCVYVTAFVVGWIRYR